VAWSNRCGCGRSVYVNVYVKRQTTLDSIYTLTVGRA